MREWLTRRRPLADLCVEFSVSRKTAFKWIRRFEQEGIAGLVDQAPKGPATGRRVSIRIGLSSSSRPSWSMMPQARFRTIYIWNQSNLVGGQNVEEYLSNNFTPAWEDFVVPSIDVIVR